MLRIVSATVAVAAITLQGAGPCTSRSGFDDDEPVVASVSFEPVDGSWDMQWVNRGSGGLQFGDTERYRVTLTGVDSPGAQDRRLQIMAGSTIIGIMQVHFPGGTAAPTFRYRTNEGAGVTPGGAMDLTDGTFWLGCTSPNRHVRGNADHGTGTQSNVSVRLAYQHDVGTPARTIRCLP